MFNIKEIMFYTGYAKVDMLTRIMWKEIIRVENVGKDLECESYLK